METTAEKTERNINIGISASNSARSTILLLFAIIAPFTLIHLNDIREKLSFYTNSDSLAYWLVCFISETVSSTAGIIWTLVIFSTIFVFFRIVKMKYGNIILMSKFISGKFSRIRDNWISGYFYVAAILSLSIATVVIAFKYFK